MKVAFVNQPICSLLKPYQSSVGACTYGLAVPLAHQNEVIAYGRKQTVNAHFHPDIETDFYEAGIRFRFLPSSTPDHLLSKAGRAFFELVPFAPAFNHGMKPAPSTSRWRYPCYTRRVAQDLQQQQCDVIHIQHSSQFVPIVRALNPDAKIILHLHAEWFPQSNPAMLAKRIQHADMITGVSDYITNQVRDRFPEVADRCETLYNGVHASHYSREKDYAKLKTRKTKRILFAGRVAADRGVHVLIEAFNQVAHRYPDVELVIYGEHGVGMMEETFPMNDKALISYLRSFYNKDFVGQLKQMLDPAIAHKVSFPGSLPNAELIDQYYDADVFVFPSICHEAFGLPPIEAMATGTPVVGTRTGGIVETIAHDQTGFLVEKQNPTELADAILKLLKDDDLRESLGKAARKRAMTQFTWDQVAEQAIEKYTRLLGQSNWRPNFTSARSQTARLPLAINL